MRGDQTRPSARDGLLRSPLDPSRSNFYDDHGVDQLFTVVLELAAEVSALRERFHVAELVAEQHGVPLRTQIERLIPTTEQAEVMAVMRRDLLKRMFRTID